MDSQVENARRVYAGLFGLEPAKTGVCQEIEKVLGVSLPEDFTCVAAVYQGGLLGGISHHAIDVRGPATNVVEETLRLRDSIGLPPALLVLAEPPESLIVLDTKGNGGAQVFWLSAEAAEELAVDPIPAEAERWASYLNFFEYLLAEEKLARGE